MRVIGRRLGGCCRRLASSGRILGGGLCSCGGPIRIGLGRRRGPLSLSLLG